jgi:hypothetical protein
MSSAVPGPNARSHRPISVAWASAAVLASGATANQSSASAQRYWLPAQLVPRGRPRTIRPWALRLLSVCDVSVVSVW